MFLTKKAHFYQKNSIKLSKNVYFVKNAANA